MDLPIIEPITKYLKEFNTTDEFNMFYTKNKKDIDVLSTHKLNKMYKIEGYRITKINGTLMLKKYDEMHDKRYVSNKEIEARKESMLEVVRKDLQTQISQMRDQYNELREVVNKIIKFFNDQKYEANE